MTTNRNEPLMFTEYKLVRQFSLPVKISVIFVFNFLLSSETTFKHVLWTS